MAAVVFVLHYYFSLAFFGSCSIPQDRCRFMPVQTVERLRASREGMYFYFQTTAQFHNLLLAIDRMGNTKVVDLTAFYIPFHV